MQNNKQYPPHVFKMILRAQRDEVTEHLIYTRISTFVKDETNKTVIDKIAAQEAIHAHIWQSYTHKEVKPNMFKVWYYIMIVRFFGLTFGIKLMEKDETDASTNYELLSQYIPEAKDIQIQEEDHEQQLIAMIKDKSLDYLGSVILGLNDALVELTGVLAGLTFGLQNSRMIAFVGIITGISAAFSMAGSEYLSTKTDGGTDIKPGIASLYTGVAYIITVVLLILPYFLFSNVYMALTLTICFAIIIIALFNFYTAIAKGYSFRKRFLEMAAISLGVAFISFIAGLLVKHFFNVDV